MPVEREMTELEKMLQARHNPTVKKQFTSDALDPQRSKLVGDLALPDESRGRMPLTQEKFVVYEPPQRVEWEREVRKAIFSLPGDGGHRISAPMIFEWATGISIKELAEAEGADQKSARGGGKNGSANVHLRHINWVLRGYFGKGYKTKIAGREVGQAYKVPKGYRIERRKPLNITLWPEWENNTLKP